MLLLSFFCRADIRDDNCAVRLFGPWPLIEETREEVFDELVRTLLCRSFTTTSLAFEDELPISA